MAKEPKFKAGDVVANEWGDRRIIIAPPFDDMYLFIDWREETPIYNPFRSAIKKENLEKKYEKIGEIDYDLLIRQVSRVVDAYNKAHIEAQPCLKKIKELCDQQDIEA